jgi:PAS domain S-box-containing protein
VLPMPLREGAKSPLNKFIVVAMFILAALALATVASISHQSGIQLQNTTRQFAHTREILEKLEQISAGLSEVESSARSFAISGKQSHLDPFYIAAQAVPQEMADLKTSLHDDAALLKSVTTIEPVINEHLKTMKDLVALGDKNLFRSFGQRGLMDQDNALMEQIHATLDPMENQQRTLLNEQQAAASAQAEHLNVITLTGSILSAALVLAFGAAAFGALHQREKAEEKLDRLLGSMPDAIVIINAEGKIIGSNAHTEKLFGYSERELQGERMALLVPEHLRQIQRQYYNAIFSQKAAGRTTVTVELCGLHKDGREFPIEVSTTPLATEKGLAATSAIRDITARKEVEQKISTLNKELENRALELEAANKELEAFSYSVSHDLRSPLQNIDSFSQILLEDYANRLDADGRDYVQRLRGSCEHMENIIDALLALSNMTRSELIMEHFDLTALAHAVAADVKQKNPDRLVDWVIAGGLTAEGDAKLLRVVLENLFGNAWKFTANRPRARIEFGALPQSNGARTYFVRDDGAGFDMVRAGNLFIPFKRLHDQNEFKGTGIGLATVQRVIQRHRGKIWAEGVVNQGATFCFTLSDEPGTLNGNHHPTA